MGKEALAKSLVSGIFIKSVLKNSPAGLSGLVFMGDRILSVCDIIMLIINIIVFFKVNDVDLIDVTHDFAVNIIKSAKNPVNFILQSLQGFIPKENVSTFKF